jgi:opacity protein-like surface antigen
MRYMTTALVLVGLLSIMAGKAAAEDGYRRLNGLQLYAGPSLTHMAIGGDFDGETILVNDDRLSGVAIEDFESAWGVGGVVGLRNALPHNLDIALELGYTQSKHDGTFLGVPADEATLKVFDVNPRLYFLTHQRFQPSLIAGMGFYSLEANDAAVNITTLTIEDAKFEGIGFNIGAGVSYFLLQRLSLDANIVYRHASFHRVNDDEIEDPLKIGNVTFGLQLLLHFGGYYGDTPPSAIKPQSRANDKPIGKPSQPSPMP